MPDEFGDDFSPCPFDPADPEPEQGPDLSGPVPAGMVYLKGRAPAFREGAGGVRLKTFSDRGGSGRPSAEEDRAGVSSKGLLSRGCKIQIRQYFKSALVYGLFQAFKNGPFLGNFRPKVYKIV